MNPFAGTAATRRSLTWLISRLGIFLEVFHSPERALARDLGGPSFLVPLLLQGAATTLLAYGQMPLQLQWARRLMESKGASPLQAALSLELMDKYSRLGLALTPFVLLLKWVAFSILLWLGCEILSRFASFLLTLNVVAYASFPLVLRDAAIYLIVSARTRDDVAGAAFDVPIGLNLLFPSLPLPWSVLAANFNLFEAWAAALATLGLARMLRSGWRSSLAVYLTCWLLVVISKAGVVFLGLSLQSRFAG